MTIYKSKKQIIIITILLLIYILVNSFYYHINRSGLSFLAFIVMAICFIILVYFVLKGIFQIFKDCDRFTLQTYSPSFIALVGIAYILFWPWNFDSENLCSEVEFRACYEGTQNQSQIKFRKNNSFEINSTGAFFYNEWFTGKWQKNGDTILLDFDNKKPRLISNDTIVIKNGHLIPISEVHQDSINYIRYYYLGYCKGLN